MKDGTEFNTQNAVANGIPDCSENQSTMETLQQVIINLLINIASAPQIRPFG